MKITVEVQHCLDEPKQPLVLACFTATIETEAGALCVDDGRIILSNSGVLRPVFSVKAGEFKWKPGVELPATLVQEVAVEALRAFDQLRGWGGRGRRGRARHSYYDGCSDR
jgi:hypothetical protein